MTFFIAGSQTAIIVYMFIERAVPFLWDEYLVFPNLMQFVDPSLRFVKRFLLRFLHVSLQCTLNAC